MRLYRSEWPSVRAHFYDVLQIPSPKAAAKQNLAIFVNREGPPQGTFLISILIFHCFSFPVWVFCVSTSVYTCLYLSTSVYVCLSLSTVVSSYSYLAIVVYVGIYRSMVVYSCLLWFAGLIPKGFDENAGDPGTFACPLLRPWYVCMSLFETLVRLHGLF